MEDVLTPGSAPNPNPVLQIVLAFTVLGYALETALDLRQLAVLRVPHMRPELDGIIAKDKFEAARAYSLDKASFGLLHSAFEFAQNLATLSWALLPWLWQVTGVECGWGSWRCQDEIPHSLLFLGTTMLFNLVLELPFSLYSTFVIEQRHGFNKQTLSLFFSDMLKSVLLSLLIGAPATVAIITIARSAGQWLVLGLWLFALLFSLFFLTLYPVIIAPLFNRFVPLEDGSLRSRIEALALSLSFPLKKIFVVDGSVRSAHSNAYLYGFFNNKRVVLYDTLIKQCSEEEVVAVIGHEMGHWKLHHTLKSFLTSQLLMLLNFAGYAYVSSSSLIFSSFGFSSRPVIIGFILFQLVTQPLNHLLTLLLNLLSRLYEFQADEFAVSLGYALPLRDGLIKLQEENKSAMVSDPLYSAYHYSHPPFLERLRAIHKKEMEHKKKSQ